MVEGQRYVNLLSDAGFKAVFGDERNKKVVISFLNMILDGERTVTDIEYMSNEVFGETVGHKSVRYDLNCRDSNGVRFLVEMQRCGMTGISSAAACTMGRKFMECR